jgi:hypothetical protein
MVKTQPINFRHCDEYVNDRRFPDCLRWFIFIHRSSAIVKNLAERMKTNPVLYADCQNIIRVRVTMTSRFGDVGITSDLNQETGYMTRVPLDKLTNFSDQP